MGIVTLHSLSPFSSAKAESFLPVAEVTDGRESDQVCDVERDVQGDMGCVDGGGVLVFFRAKMKKTRASGRNVGKVFNPVVKLVLENQPFLTFCNCQSESMHSSRQEVGAS